MIKNKFDSIKYAFWIHFHKEIFPSIRFIEDNCKNRFICYILYNNSENIQLSKCLNSRNNPQILIESKSYYMSTSYPN